MILNETDLYNLVNGASFLGSGGGGMKSSGRTFVEEILKGPTKAVELLTHPLTPDDDEKLACIICDFGASSKFDNNQAHALDMAFQGLANAFEDLGPIEAFFPIETGPENTLAPFVLAAKYNLPVIDGDGAARAVPTLPLCTFYIEGPNNPLPIALASGRGDVLMVATDNVESLEAMLRPLSQIYPFNSSASLALWPGKVGVLKKHAIEGTVSNALYCGMLFDAIIKEDESAIQKVTPKVNRLQGYLIRKGRLLFKVSNERGGFNFDTTRILTDEGETITVVAQNENLMVFSDQVDGPIAMAPDSICYLTRDMVPLTNAEVPKTSQLTELYLYIIGVVANKRLNDPTIIKGFDDHVQELRYNTRLSGQKPTPKPLGDLIVELGKLK